MVQCQCIKTDGKKCTREVSTKAGDNHMYCWQHQKCPTGLTGSTGPTGKLPKPVEIELKSEMKYPNLAKWIKNNVFKGGHFNTGYEYLPDKFYDELGAKAFGYIIKTEYMYDFWAVILNISPFPSWIKNPEQLDGIYEEMQDNDNGKLIYELRAAFEKDGGRLPYSKDIYTKDDQPFTNR
jgi:hypothetical protein